MWMMRVTVSPSTTAASIFATSSAPAASPSSRDLVSAARTSAMTMSRTPMQRVPMPSQTPSPVSEGEADAAEGEDQADEGAEVLQEDDGQLGGLGAADELGPGLLAAELVGLLDGGAEGEALGDDREDQDADRPVPVPRSRAGA